jgi:glyoxylase-like metal-dependent hydrolase (beta-lactamase superfamily II)
MAFLTEPAPERGVALTVVPGISRIVANNLSLITYHGTNTYLIEGHDGIVVLDPGPDDDGHLKDVLTAPQGQVSAILLSHTHSDHLGATAALRTLEQTSAL